MIISLQKRFILILHNLVHMKGKQHINRYKHKIFGRPDAKKNLLNKCFDKWDESIFLIQ